MKWMTRYRSSFGALCLALSLAGCTTPSGVEAARIAEPDIAGGYLPLAGRIDLGLDKAAGKQVREYGGEFRLWACPLLFQQQRSRVVVRQKVQRYWPFSPIGRYLQDRGAGKAAMREQRGVAECVAADRCFDIERHARERTHQRQQVIAES